MSPLSSTQRSLFLGVVTLVVCIVVGVGSAAHVAAQDGTATARGTVRGTVEGESRPLPDVLVIVELEGETVAEATTDENGRWEVELTELGSYVFRLDPSTFPPGTEAVEEPLTVREIEAGSNTVVLAPTTTADGTAVTGAGTGKGTASQLLNLAAQGLKLGSIIALMAVGLSLIFSVTGLVNFSHGEIVTFGAISAFYLNVEAGIPLLLVGPIVVVLGALLGLANEVGIWRPLRRRRSGRISLIVISIGLSILVRHVYLIFYGPGSNIYADYSRQRAFDVGPISLPPHDYAIIGVSVATLLGIGLLLQRTRIGTAIRAVADNRDLAAASGIDVDHVVRVVWAIGASMAALGGLMQGLTEVVLWDMGFKLLLLIFAAVILGGIGTAFGAAVGGIVIGIVTQTSTYWIDNELKVAMALAVMIGVLLVRPQGILGQPERVG